MSRAKNPSTKKTASKASKKDTSTKPGKANTVVVVGSLNIDYFARVETLPQPGETVAAERLTLFHGGKGANQAIAASRQGCRTVLIGAVGTDEAGSVYLRELTEEGVDVGPVRIAPAQTGAAFITVDRTGENMIVIAPGANAELRRTDIAKHVHEIESADALLGQFEVPFGPLVEAIRIANREDIPVILNPSPSLPSFPWEEVRTDYLVVNETEAVELFGFVPAPSAIEAVRERLHELRAQHLLVTRGADETLVFAARGEFFSVPTMAALPVDTVGAGDAFAGCFAARIACGEPLRDAVYAANCAGALATLGAGAQDPIPDRERVDQHRSHLLA